MIAVALLLLVQAAPLQAVSPQAARPGPRAGIAGIGGFQCVSTLDYGGVRNRLTATYVFPDRTRWHFDNPEDRKAPLLSFYRFGKQLFVLEGNASRRLDDEQGDSMIRQMELRRAVLLWPDGFSWSAGEGDTRTAVLHADSCRHEGPLGTLVAHLADGRPTRIEVRDMEGEARETLTVSEWQQRLGRSWPRVLTVAGVNGGFSETIESIETQIHYLDLFFVPPDQRVLPKSDAGGARVMALDLVAVRYEPRELPAGTTWEEALTRTRAWIEEAGSDWNARGLVIDLVPTLEIGPKGLPARAWLRLKELPAKPLEGFTSIGERPGLILALSSLDEVGPKALEQLRAAVPAGSKGGTPYLRFHARPNLPVELVLPLESAD